MYKLTTHYPVTDSTYVDFVGDYNLALHQFNFAEVLGMVGKMDLSVWVEGTGEWHTLKSFNRTSVEHWNGTSFQTTPVNDWHNDPSHNYTP